MIRRLALAVLMCGALLAAGLPTAWATAQDAAFYPVNSSSANLVLVNSDMVVDPMWPIRLEDTYNSRDTRDDVLGQSWTNPVEWRLFVGNGSVLAIHGDGLREYMTQVGQTNWYRGAAGALQHRDDDTWVLSTYGQDRRPATIEFNPAGQIVRYSSPFLRTLSFDHSQAGFVTRIHDDNGRSVSFTYSFRGRLQQAIADDGRTVSWTYSDQGELTDITDPMGATTHYTYDGHGHVASVIDATGRTVRRMEYDTEGRPLRQWDALGGLRAIDYSTDKTLVTVTNPRGFASTYQDDGHGHPLRDTDETGASAVRTYDAAGNRTSFTDANGKAWHYYRSARAAAVIDPNDETTAYLYNSFGKLDEVDLSSGAAWKYAYDDSGYPVRVDDPWGTSVRLERDADHRITMLTDVHSRDTHFEYDATGHQTGTVDPSGEQYATYDELGRVSTFSNGDSQASLTYDLDGRLIAMQDNSGVTTFVYDAAGYLQQMVDPNLGTVDVNFDPRGMLASLHSDSNAPISFEYDASRDRTAFTDSHGRRVSFSYDPRNYLVGVVDAAGNAWKLTYDPNGNLTEATAPDGHAAKFSYTFRNDLESAIDRTGQLSYLPTNSAGFPETRAVADPFSGQAVEVNSSVGAWEPTLDLRPGAQSSDSFGRILGALRAPVSARFAADGSLQAWGVDAADPTSFEARVQTRLQAAARAMRGPDTAQSRIAQLLDPIPDPDTGPRSTN